MEPPPTASPSEPTPPRRDPAPRWFALPAAVLVVGLCTGVIGMALTLFIDAVEFVSFGRRISMGDAGVSGVPRWRVATAMALGGIVAGLIWYRLRRRPISTVKDAIGGSPLGGATVGDAFAQLIVVGTGASVGREAAPRQIAAWVAEQVSRRSHLDPQTRASLLASAAGAGLGAVYNVPIAGAVMSVEMLLRPNLATRHGWRHVLIAVSTSVIATVTAWPIVGRRPVYHFPSVPLPTPTTASILALVSIVALTVIVTQAIGDAFGSLSRASRGHSTTGRRLPFALAIAGIGVAAISWWAPQVPGNGRPLIQLVLLSPPGVVACLGLMLAKASATAISLRAGAAGGMLTPTLAVGAACGAAIGQLLDPSLTTVTALVGAAVALSVTQHAPWFAVVFAVELTDAHLAPALITGVAVASGYGLHLLRHRVTNQYQRRHAELR